MWVVVMFDLPVDTKSARTAAQHFREFLKGDGFHRMQYSVYARPCPSEENAQVHKDRVRLGLPPDGEVRILTFTDLQFSRMLVFHGKRRGTPEKAPRQLEIF